jgi:hypothetical protein
MLPASCERILDTLPDDAAVLDVGAWAKPFARADWVIDLLPYETRGEWGYDGPGGEHERFESATWVQRDICDREPWPFADDQFDFAICSHTLEDVRDPVWVCEELKRVARAGYIEVPSRLEEQTYGFQGPWVGWGHHHWLTDVGPDGLQFVFKHQVVEREGNHFPPRFLGVLTPELRVSTLWWEGDFAVSERYFLDGHELEEYLQELIRRNRRSIPTRARQVPIVRRFVRGPIPVPSVGGLPALM